MDEIWQALELLVRQGKIIYAGCSNFAGWHIGEANAAARIRNFLGLISLQCRYNLTARAVELEVIPACEAYGLGLLPWGPLADGLLGGVLKKGPGAVRGTAYEFVRSWLEKNRAKVEAWENLCRALSLPPGQAGLAWLLHQKAVTAPIIGPRTPAHLESALGALTVKFSAETLSQIDALFPGYQPAPKGFSPW